MTGAWKGGLALANATSIGAVTSGNSTGTVVATSASTFTKGAWVPLIAATTTDINWVCLYVNTESTGGSTFGVDIGVGTLGNEVAVVTNLCYAVINVGVLFFPLSISAGSRIVARHSSNQGSSQLYILMQGFQDTWQSVATGSAIDTFGFNAALNIGAPVDAGGSANTKGAYTQIATNTGSDYSGFFFAIDNQNASGSVGVTQYLLDIAVGASGSEVVILPNVYQGAFNLSLYPSPQTMYYPIQIPAGSRIAVRMQCTTATSPDRVLGITFYGVRL